MKKGINHKIIDNVCKINGYSLYQFRKFWGVSFKEGDRNFDSIFINLDEYSQNKESLPHELIKVVFIYDKKDMEGLNETIENCIFIDIKNHLIYGKNDLSTFVNNIINSLNYNANNENKETPIITYLIIGANIVMFLITVLYSGEFFQFDGTVLRTLGAKDNSLIIAGEYYRLFTCMFLHGGIIHVFLNMYSLYSIGPLVERVYGKSKYIVIYLAAGITSSLFSFFFSNGLSVGASGAIFGLLGATLIFAYGIKNEVGKGFLRNILSVIIINLFIGFTFPNIDNYAHLGGLLGGIITTYIWKIAE